MKKKVAVLMATYNGMAYVKEQIDSILDQQEVDIQLFISDDSSSDGTLDYIKGLGKKRITILDNSNENLGSAGKNFFYLICNVNVSEYDYVALADQDDIWLKNKLEKAITYLINNNADSYSSGFCAFWEDGRKKYFKKSPKLAKYDYLFSSPGPGCTFVLKTCIIQSLMQYISSNKLNSNVQHHDWAIYAWARSMNFKWVIDTNSYILYRQHASNDTGVNNGYNAIEKRIKWIIKGWYTSQIIQILDFIKYTNNFNNSFNCFKVGRVQFLSGYLSYRRNKRECLFVLMLLLFNIISQKKIKYSIMKIESEIFG